MSNIKNKRIAALIVRELSNIFHEEVKDEKIKDITIVDAKVSNDLSVAKVYYTYLGNVDRQIVANELKNASSYLRSELAQTIDLRTTPELRFVYDESLEYGDHIDEVIDNLHHQD